MHYKLIVAIFFVHTLAFADGVEIKESRKGLGKVFDSAVTLKTSGSGSEGEVQSASSETKVKVLGKSVSILKTEVTVANATTVEAKTYVFGKKIASDLPEFDNQKWKATLPPFDHSITPVNYSIGPVLLKVKAGLRGEGEATAEVQPNQQDPIENSSVDVDLDLHANADAYLDAYAKAFILKAGLTGDMLLVKADGNLHGTFTFLGEKPVLVYDAQLEAFNGKVAGYLDIYNIFKGKYKHVWQGNLVEWNGFCKSFSSSGNPGTCPN